VSLLATFVRLRLVLLRNAFRLGPPARFGALLGWGFGLTMGSLGALAAVALRPVDDTDTTIVLVVLFTIAALAGAIGPLTLGGVTEIVTPERLAPFPLSLGQRAAGMLVVNLIGPAPLALALALAGVAVGVTERPAGAPVVVVALAIEWLLVLLLARVPVTFLARAFASRRGRDAALAMAGLLGLLGIAMQWMLVMVDEIEVATWAPVADVLTWLPPGALGRAAVTAGRTSTVGALGWLLVGAAGVVAAGGLWLVALRRLDAAAPGGGTRAAERAPRQVSVLGRLRPVLPAGPAGAVAARELRYQARDPRRRVQAVAAIVFGVIYPAMAILTGDRAGDPSAAVLFAAGVGWLTVLGALNQFGADAGALWFDLSSAASPRDLVVGKNLAEAIVSLLAVVVASALLLTLTGGWRYLPAAFLVGASGLVLGLGVANVASVTAPYAVPDGSNPFSVKNSGQGCLQAVLATAAFAAFAVLAIPMVLPVLLLHDDPVACALVGLVALPYGLVIWRASIRPTARRLTLGVPELLAATNPA
jgi:ABC-2 type transport system permease protein